MITTVQSDQRQILADIARLHLPDGVIDYHLDATFGKGGFWPTADMGIVRIRSDRMACGNPAQNLRADFTALPFQSGSIESMVLDPPFIHAAGKDSAMGKQFGSYPTQFALRLAYRRAILEAARVLQPGGVLVFKCQDIVESGKQVWNHVDVLDRAGLYGLEAIDLFILHRARPPMVGHNHGRQLHARKTHSYFWVFKKGGRA